MDTKAVPKCDRETWLTPSFGKGVRDCFPNVFIWMVGQLIFPRSLPLKIKLQSWLRDGISLA